MCHYSKVLLRDVTYFKIATIGSCGHDDHQLIWLTRFTTPYNNHITKFIFFQRNWSTISFASSNQMPTSYRK